MESDTNWVNITPEQLAPAKSIYTMLSFDEERILFDFASRNQGGAIVDLGCYMGGSSARLALGALASNYRPELHLYDRFRFLEDERIKYLPKRLRSFERGCDIVRNLIEPIYQDIHIHAGEFLESKWVQKPIDLLFVDLAKTWDNLDKILLDFYPYMRQGAYLIQQDYNFKKTPWIAVHMEIWQDKFDYICHAPQGSVVFKLKEQITVDEANLRLLNGLYNLEFEIVLKRARETGIKRGYGNIFDTWFQDITDFGVWKTTRQYEKLAQLRQTNAKNL